MAERVALILPALNEEGAIATTLDEIARAAPGGILRCPDSQSASLTVEMLQVIVVDNGSTDHTAELARAHGAQVVSEPRRGYGQACLAGIAALAPEVTIVVFMDADGSDDPADLPTLVRPIARRDADFVIATRTSSTSEAGALTPQQRFGNRLATALLRLLFRASYSDLGPFRAIRRDALERLQMRDPNFGWTIEMQIKAHWAGLRTLEIPSRYRCRRGGSSKVSGTVRGSFLAGAKILWTILRYRLAR